MSSLECCHCHKEVAVTKEEAAKYPHRGAFGSHRAGIMFGCNECSKAGVLNSTKDYGG